MFQSDKELKKRGGRDDVVQKARRERENRERLRGQLSYVLLLERVYRGFIVRRKTKDAIKAEWDRKLADIIAVRKNLAARSVPFALPVAISLSMLQQLLYICDLSKIDNRRGLISFCEDGLLPAMRSSDSSLNPATLLAKGDPASRLRLKRLLAICLKFVVWRATEERANLDTDAVTQVLLLLTGCTDHATSADLLSSNSHYTSDVTTLCRNYCILELDIVSLARKALIAQIKQPSFAPSSTKSQNSSVLYVPTQTHPCAILLWEICMTCSTPTNELAVRIVLDLMTVPILATILGTRTIDTFTASISELKPGALETSGKDNSASSIFMACIYEYCMYSDHPGAGSLTTTASPLRGVSSVLLLTANIIQLYQHIADTDRLPLQQECKLLVLLTKLLSSHHIPGSIFSDVQSIIIEKSATGTSMDAISIPEPIQNQMKLLVSETALKGLTKRFLRGIDDSTVLRPPTQDEINETNQAQATSVSQQAADGLESQRLRESKWFGAKWAEKILPKWPWGGGTQNNANGGSRRNSKNDVLENVSDQSKSVAMKGTGGDTQNSLKNIDSTRTTEEYSKDSVAIYVCYMSVILRRWGFGKNANNSTAMSVLNSLCFSASSTISKLWAFIRKEGGGDNIEKTLKSMQTPLSNVYNSEILDTLFNSDQKFTYGRDQNACILLNACTVLCVLLSHYLIIVDDSELYEKGRPLPVHELRMFIRSMKHVLFNGVFASGPVPERRRSGGSQQNDQDTTAVYEHQVPKQPVKVAAENEDSPVHVSFLLATIEHTLQRLRARSARRALGNESIWTVDDANTPRVLGEVRLQTPRAVSMLTVMPWSISLMDRMRTFRAFCASEKARHQPEGQPGVSISVRRGHVLEDYLSVVNRTRIDLKKRLQIQYRSELGHQESGIDIGGLFKDFWTELSSTVLTTNFGLFITTEGGMLYPNPASATLHKDHLRLFELLGGILGKALFEGITVQSQFATFFLGFVRGNCDFLNLFHDLRGMDYELYKNLIFLKTYEGSIEDLCLTFTVTDENFGEKKEIELLPRGSSTPVTSKNRFDYINRVAKYRLVDQVRSQAEAFVRGLRDVVPYQWLHMFTEPELQVLISGSGQPIDMEDLRRHTSYSGYLGTADPTIRKFWRVFSSFSPSEKAGLLKFVTSCERPPSLGFEALHPPFTIHRVHSDDERLPTASTCFNTLKLPAYSSEKAMREKLLVSIFSGAGFDLS